jgi:hypothetical protein
MSRQVDSAAAVCRWQGFILRLIVAGRQQAHVFGCREGGWPSKAGPSIDGGTAPEALHVHLEDGGVVHETINSSKPHGRVAEGSRRPPNSNG